MPRSVRVHGDTAFMDDFSDMLLLKLFDVATRRSADYDKVKSNAVRALGNLLRYLPERSYNSSRFTQVLEKAIDALVKNITTGTMKVRWNACYAAGNMFHNDLLPVGQSAWGVAMYEALTLVVRECKNFKVRINAALALGIPASRAHYGPVPLYASVWESLLAALKSTEDITDLAEYRYRDNLTEQVAATVTHLAGVMENGDLAGVGRIVEKHQQLLHEHIYTHAQALRKPGASADKVSMLAATIDHLQQLTPTAGQWEMEAGWNILLTVFTQPVTGLPEPITADEQTNPEELDRGSPIQSGFRDVYD